MDQSEAYFLEALRCALHGEKNSRPGDAELYRLASAHHILPLIADSLLQNMELLTDAVDLFRTRCVELLQPDPERCLEILSSSYAFATAYAPKLGYDRVAGIIKKNSGDPVRIQKELDAAVAALE